MKKLLLSCGLVGVIGVGASLAYFSDVTDTLINKFTLFGAGDGQQAIELRVKESPVKLNPGTHNYVVDTEKLQEDGMIYDTDSVNPSNEYLNLIPGSTVAKDPTVEVQPNTLKSIVVVRIENYAQSSYTINEANIGTGPKQWTVLDDYKDKTNKNVTFFQYNSEVSTTDTSLDLPELFTGLTIIKDESLTEETKIDDMIISAAAVQVENNNSALEQAIEKLGGVKKQ